MKNFLTWGITTGSSAKYLTPVNFVALPSNVLAIAKNLIAKIELAMAALPAAPEGGAAQPPPRPGGSAFQRWWRSGSFIRWLGFGGAWIPTLMLAFILVILFVKAWPAIQINGLDFFTKSVWNTGNQYGSSVTSHGITYISGQHYGAVPQIVGTLETSLIALIIAVPVSIGAALVVVERLPRRLASLIGGFLELLAGIPSVVIGLWGVLTFGPFIAKYIAPVLAKTPDSRSSRGTSGTARACSCPAWYSPSW